MAAEMAEVKSKRSAVDTAELEQRGPMSLRSRFGSKVKTRLHGSHQNRDKDERNSPTTLGSKLPSGIR